jgi:type IV secretion system protein VirD4
MFWRILRALRHYPQRLGLTGLGLTLLAAATGWYAPLQHYLTIAAALVVGGTFAWWVVYRLVVPVTTGTWVQRRDDEAEHAGGVASRLDIGEHASAGAMRRRACTLRPSMASMSWLARRRVPVTGYAVQLLTAGWMRATSAVWSPCEAVTLRLGGPRMGKSGSLASHALDAPGALILATSRTDLLDLSRDVRAAQGRVEVFNPTGLGDLPSTVRWTPLTGCGDLATAQRRASDLIPQSEGEAERWDAQARGLLTILLHAAALSGGNMRNVLGWISPADETSRDEVLLALAASPSYRAVASETRSVFGTNDRTLTSITTTLLPAVRWLAEETAAQVGDAPLDHPDQLDVRSLVAGGQDSLYLIGREGACRALIGALTAEIAHQARMVAAGCPAGRLDPPLTLVLDEAPLTCGPIPLHDWTADMGGRGVTIHLAAQSLAQLRDVWGLDRADAITGNVGSLLVFGGIKAATDLERLSTLTGTRLVQVDEDDRRAYPVMTPAQIAGLPAGVALLLQNGLRPIVGQAPMAWDRRPAGRRYARARAWIDRLSLLTARAARARLARTERVAAETATTEPAPASAADDTRADEKRGAAA